MNKSPDVLKEMQGLLPFFVRDPNMGPFGRFREGFQPETRFEFRSPDGNKIATPALDFLISCIGGMDAYAEDADLPLTLSSGELIYRNAGALSQLAEATQRIVRFDAYPHAGTLRPFPLFKVSSKAEWLHGAYLLALFEVLRKNPDAWLITNRGTTRVNTNSRLRTWESTFADKWHEILVVRPPHEEFFTN